MIIAQRKASLLNLKKLALNIIDQNKRFDPKTDTWKKKVIEKNIYRLKKALSEINYALKGSSLESFENSYSYIENRKDQQTGDMAPELYQHFQNLHITPPLFSLESTIVECSILVSLVLEVDLMLHLNFNDIKKIVFNQSDLSELQVHIPSAQALLADKSKQTFISADQSETIRSAIELSSKAHYLSSNILLHACLESITLNFLAYTYFQQNPSLKESEIRKVIYDDHYSLQKTINKLKFKEDLSISYLDASILFRNSFDSKIVQMDKNMELHKKAIRSVRELQFTASKLLKLDKIDERNLDVLKSKINKINTNLEKSKINHIKDEESISIKHKLEFLKKSIYDDRNSLFHGKFFNVQNQPKNYLFIMAVNKIIDLFIEMKIKYEVKKA